MSGEGGEDEDARDGKVEAGGNNRLKPGSLELLQASTLCPSVVADYGDCNGRTVTYNPNVNSEPKEDSSPEDDLDDDVSGIWLFRLLCGSFLQLNTDARGWILKCYVNS